MTNISNVVPLYFKLGGCLFLVLQSVVVLVLMKSLGGGSDGFINSTVVLSSELVKLLLSLPFVMKEAYSEAMRNEVNPAGIPRKVPPTILKVVFQLPGLTFAKIVTNDLSGFIQMSIPALIYAIQNNIIFYAVGLLPMSVYQVAYQMKILTTAGFSSFLLKRPIPMYQQVSLILLTIGVAVVSLSQASAKSSEASDGISFDMNSLENLTKGLLAVAFACMTSGFAGILCEKLYKDNTSSLWVRNCQLGVFSVLCTSIFCLVADYEKIFSLGFFAGWQPLTYTLPFLHAVGGMSVAFIVKYMDNIAKGFATSFSMVIGAVCSWYYFETPISLSFTFGAVLVIIATLLYSKPNQSPSVLAASHSIMKEKVM